jgi:hypothetical protein
MGRQARLRKRRARLRRAADCIQLYERVAAQVLPQHFSADCCINGTRVALDVLAHFGVEARPVPVRAFAFNKVMYERLTAEPEPDQAMLDQWIAEGGWSCGIVGDANDGWPYHLVALAEGYLIDSASGQFYRPQHDICVAPVIALPIQPGFEQGAPMRVVNEVGTVLQYERVDDSTYEDVSGFQRSPWNLDVIKKVIAEMSATGGANRHQGNQ